MERDIPVAERIKAPSQSTQIRKFPWLWLTVGLGVGIIGLALAWILPKMLASSVPSAVATRPVPPGPSSPNNPDNILGHLPYPEAPLTELVPITPDGRVKLRKAAAQEFKKMVADAQAAGVAIMPLSGFRSKTDQDHLFFGVKKERGQETTERALVSAPPGYSEHHTGYAIDVGDAADPASYLHPDFDQTEAFAWMQKNAAYYSFELSFPKNNPQGISYEPWHWRYVGDQASLKAFYQARQLAKQSLPQVNSPQLPTNP
ncbi:D-alanyl-D-alanine carboxypeptidase family protein [Synechococcus sp. PCC 6312]|uniref:M15 family metallopeptidase n=1 Tax=Synechococcus sp. (strain ATCC 27167 / PCC 6312) TaxID=195253 RepID=UPI00029ED833|nr:M15 family metallopeptidase [Synechococcus sp. PCC 6312]AFY60884.1 D-Ala-D-Ala carboxypeptidase [Synechococcus sp. PCC 6312]